MLLVCYPVHGTIPRRERSEFARVVFTVRRLIDSRPLSSTAASLMLNEDGSLYAVLGGSGGSRIFPALAQVILNLECGLNISAAIERPRVHNQIVPLETTVEVGPEGSNVDMMDDLRRRGHNISEFDINIGIAEGELGIEDRVGG